MPASPNAFVAPLFAMVLLVLLVALRMLFVRIGEMRRGRIHPQAIATSAKAAARFEDTRAADNFRNLFELPVLFYALMATALATSHTPGWLLAGAWVFVALRALHSLIQCGYNKVMHRFVVFLLGFGLLMGLWVGFFVTLPRP